MKAKKGQIQLTFNWVYILIAGTLILLFFVGLVFKQKSLSEDRLTVEVVEVLDTIFTGASVSEKTKHFIDTSGLAEYTLSFTCEDGLTDFGIKDSSARAQNTVTPIFSLKEITSPQLILWSLPYKLPFKVIDFLFVTSINTKYILLGAETKFSLEFINATDDQNSQLKIKTEEAITLNEITAVGNLDIRIIDLDGTLIRPNNLLPENLQNVDYRKISAVSFVAAEAVDFYQVSRERRWVKINLNPVPIISVTEERDAAKYAAIFAADDSMYRCNMQKAFQRLGYLIDIYAKKTNYLIDYYSARDDLARAGDCLLSLKSTEQSSVQSILNRHGTTAKRTCRVVLASGGGLGDCVGLEDSADSLKQLNDKLQNDGCVTIY